MSEIHKIEDLRVWQNARVLCKTIYTLTHKEDFEKDFRFVQQIRAAAGSIMIEPAAARICCTNRKSFSKSSLWVSV